MVLPKEPTLKDIDDKVTATKDEVAAVKLKVESVIEIVSRLELVAKRLEETTREIKGILPKGFVTGATYRIRQ